MKKITLVQDPEELVPADLIAKAIIEIGEAAKKLTTSGLKREAVVALIHDNSNISKRDIRLVLNNLEGLRETWCTR